MNYVINLLINNCPAITIITKFNKENQFNIIKDNVQKKKPFLKLFKNRICYAKYSFYFNTKYKL